MTSLIHTARLSQAITVNELARRLGVTASAVSQLERSELEGTIKLKSLSEALSALGFSLDVAARPRTRLTDLAPHRVAIEMADALFTTRDTSYPLRLLSERADGLRRHLELLDDIEIATPPVPLSDSRWDALFKAVYGEVLSGPGRPPWAASTRLAKPWYVSEFPALREKAKTETPRYLSDVNIFIDRASLSAA